MKLKFSFGESKQICGEASINIQASEQDVFFFIADNFFNNYPKWAPEVVELEPLDKTPVHIGTRGRQVREDYDTQIESMFEVVEFNPYSVFSIQGLSTPYKQTYRVESEEEASHTTLTFKFDLLEIEIYMRPFEKLIKIAIEDGAESTVQRIRELVQSQQLQIAS